MSFSMPTRFARLRNLLCFAGALALLCVPSRAFGQAGTIALTPLAVTTIYDAENTMLTATGVFQGNGFPTAPVIFQVDDGPRLIAGCGAYSNTAICNSVYYTANLAPGTHTLRVSFEGDENYAPAEATAPLFVNGGKLTISVDSLDVHVDQGTATLTATGAWDGPMPLGNVFFAVDGGNFQNGGCLTGDSYARCFAAFPISTLTPGFHEIDAYVVGDPAYGLIQGNGMLLVEGTPSGAE